MCVIMRKPRADAEVSTFHAGTPSGDILGWCLVDRTSLRKFNLQWAVDNQIGKLLRHRRGQRRNGDVVDALTFSYYRY
jgi:hypothetical protein